MQFFRAERNFLLALAAVTLLGACLRVYGISEQPLLPDEVHAAYSAAHYMEGGQFGPTMWYHPNLRNIVLYWAGTLFGQGPVSLRATSLLAGVVTVPLAGLLLFALTRSRLASVLVAFLLAVDGVHIALSRQAIQETWTTVFFLLGVLLTVLHHQRGLPWLLVASGIAFGLGVSSKFHALPPLLVCLGVALHQAWKERSVPQGCFVVASLVVLPATVYVLTFLPWFDRGYDLAEWIAMQKVLLAKMLTHRGNPMDQVVDTRAWQWFLRPMGYASFVQYQGVPCVTIAFANPLVWLLTLPASVHVVRKLVRQKGAGDENDGRVLLVLLAAVCYAPLALSPRPIWLLSSLAVLPFALMITAVAMADVAGGVTRGKQLLIGYVLLVLASSLMLYPLAVGKGKQAKYLESVVDRFRPPFESTAAPPH